MNAIIAALPAILGATVLVIFQILKGHGKGDRITEEILSKLRKEDVGAAAKYKNFGPKALAKAIERDAGLQKLREGNDYQLLRQALQQQFIISLVVYTLSVIAIIVGIWLFILHQRDISGNEREKERIALEAKRQESNSTVAKQMGEMRIAIATLSKTIAERPQSDTGGHPPPLDSQALQRAKELEAKLAESDKQVAAYKKAFGELPKSLDSTVLQDATNTIAKVRAIGDRLGFMTARAAEEDLDPKVKQRIGVLLDGHRISDPEIVNWSNLLRDPSNPEGVALRAKYPKFLSWQYIQIPVGSSAYDASQFCPEGQCLIAKASEFIEAVKNPSTPEADRKTSLKWLIPLIGNLHRPLHCADRDKDRGGNMVRITPGRKNLHAMWDSDFPKALAEENEAEDFAVRANTEVTAQQRREWRAGTPEDWAWESFKIAEEKVYAGIPRVPQGSSDASAITLPLGYEAMAKQVVKTQIQKGGVRLAWILNSAFGTP